MDAPLNAAQAASQLAEVYKVMHHAREMGRKHRNCFDRLKFLHRKARALAAAQVEGPNQKQRDAAIFLHPVPAEIKVAAAEVCQAAGLGPDGPDTVGELEWLRGRAESLADEWSAAAYDERSHLSGWQTVASMAKAEAEMAPPERMPA